MVVLSSRTFFKSPDGGITKRIEEHFWKRVIVYEVDEEEKRIEIPSDKLGLDATIDDIENYILSYLEIYATQKEGEV